MRFKQFVDYSLALWEAGRTETAIALLGPPGIGKSAAARALARAMTAQRQAKNPLAGEALCEVIDLTNRMPEDIGGIPFRALMGTVDITVYAVQSWLARLCQPGAYGVLLLDDLPTASPAVQVAVRALILDRMIGDARLSDDVLIVVTGNRRQDGSKAVTLPAHFRNSVLFLEIEVDADEWCQWAADEEIEPALVSFISFKPGLLAKLPADADELGAFPTPRTWHKLALMYDVACRCKTLLPTAAGLVGSGAAMEFIAYINTRLELPSPADVLKEPVRTLPDVKKVLNSPDKRHALITGISELVAARWKALGDQKGPRAALLKEAVLALVHVSTENEDQLIVGVRTLTMLGGAGLTKEFAFAFIQTAQAVKTNPSATPLERTVANASSVFAKFVGG